MEHSVSQSTLLRHWAEATVPGQKNADILDHKLIIFLQVANAHQVVPIAVDLTSRSCQPNSHSHFLVSLTLSSPINHLFCHSKTNFPILRDNTPFWLAYF